LVNFDKVVKQVKNIKVANIILYWSITDWHKNDTKILFTYAGLIK